MAQRRRSNRASRRPSRASRRAPLIAPQTARSILGIVLLVAGAVTLIALLLPGEGILNRYVNDLLKPAFGQGAWLLGVLLVVAGVLVERGTRVQRGWVALTLGGLLVFVAGEGLIHLLSGRGDDGREGLLALRQAGGLTITQDRASSLVFDLPGGARDVGGAVECLPIDEIAERLTMLNQPEHVTK